MKKRTLDRILSIDLYIAIATLSALIIITFIGAIMRYAFNSPFAWQKEIQIGLIIWSVFFGGSAAFRMGNHIAIDIIVDRFPEKVKKLFEIVIYVIVIVVLAYLLFCSYKMVVQLSQGNRVTDILYIPKQYIYLCIPISCFLMIVNYTICVLRKIEEGNTKKKGNEVV